MGINRDYLGRTFPVTDPYEVSRVKIAEFAGAIGDPNPVYRDRAAAQAAGYPDVIAPPTFPVAPDHVADHLALPRGSMVLYVVQTDYSAADEPLLYSREYHLPDAFDFVIWRRGPAQLRASPSE